MKKTYTDEQIVGILRGFASSGQTVRDYCRTKAINETTFYKWRNRFGSMEIAEVREHKKLQAENSRLKKLLAERDLDIDAMKELLAKKW